MREGGGRGWKGEGKGGWRVEGGWRGEGKWVREDGGVSGCTEWVRVRKDGGVSGCSE